MEIYCFWNLSLILLLHQVHRELASLRAVVERAQTERDREKKEGRENLTIVEEADEEEAVTGSSWWSWCLQILLRTLSSYVVQYGPIW